MSKHINILYVSETMPGESGYGGAQRTNLVFNALKKCGSVYCLYCYGPEDSLDPKLKRIEWRDVCGWRHYANSIWWRLYQKILPDVPGWNMQYYAFPHYLQLAELFPGVTFDIVVARYYRMVGMYHLWRYAPVLIDIDDHPVQMYQTMIRRGYGKMHRWLSDCFLKWICILIEKNFCYGWIVSSDQMRFVSNDIQMEVLPNIPIQPSSDYVRSRNREMRLVTVGSMAHPPNIEGIDWFLSAVWPLVHERWPKLEYWIVGGGGSQENLDRWSSYPSVKVLRFVKDLEPIYASAMATVVPILSGSGSCIKTLETLAYSCACLTTEFGARGIDKNLAFDDSHGLYVWHSAGDFLEKLEKIVNGSGVEKSERDGRKMIDDSYSQKAFENSVSSLIQKVKNKQTSLRWF